MEHFYNKLCILIVLSTVAVCLLTEQFAHNIFGIGPPGQFAAFQMDSEQSIRLMVERTDIDGLFSTGGFCMRRDLYGEPYLSAWGLHGKFFSLLYQIIGTSYQPFYACGEYLMAFMLAMTITIFALFCYYEWGKSAAIALIIGTLGSQWLVFAARNMFLVYWLHLLPFVASFILFPRQRYLENKVMNGYFLIIAMIILIKSLCYLDYSSNIVLSALAGPIYYSVKYKPDVANSRSLWWIGTGLGLNSLAVLIAIVSTAVQASIYTGSIFGGFDQLINVAIARMYGTTDAIRSCPASIGIMQILDYYLALPVFTLPFDPGPPRPYFTFMSAIWAGIGFSTFASLISNRIATTHKMVMELSALAAVTIWGLIATLSWAVLMKGHMVYHGHMNGMIFYIPYVLLLYILAGKMLGIIIKRYGKIDGSI